ncbi:DUF4190 domain-containing protein [Bacillus chungangensis]|uniref:Lipopolysaccharide export LptBFGC system permease protein LptF n=1 Tax=Bacillus chungangensis TaxID=587633 RepID=A0ABT9WPX2_9BACI|nr:DUF4190 domain-containing protein [Bacillus chungangensis]MDQ0175203.1 lipopolysaccharide export LptBFGC system permease protein LptF [Bacillus chungangensis]
MNNNSRSNNSKEDSPHRNEQEELRRDRQYNEEMATEMAPPPTSIRDNNDREEVGDEGNGRVMGYTGLVISILALFFWPVFLGAIGVILGFFARRRGSATLGVSSIVIGAFALILGLFILPFLRT